MLKHNCKRLPMLKNTIKRLLMLKHTSKRLPIKHNYKKNVWHLNTWYTIRGAHNTNQIQTLWDSRISKIWTLKKKFKVNFWMLNNFDRVLALLNCCRVLLFFKSSLLYIEVWNERWVASTSKNSRLKLWSITNDSLPDMVIVLWMINFKCILCMKEHCCMQSYYPCLVAETNSV